MTDPYHPQYLEHIPGESGLYDGVTSVKLDTGDLRINYLLGTITRSGSGRTEANSVVYTTLLAFPPHRCLVQLDNAAEFAPP